MSDAFGSIRAATPDDAQAVAEIYLAARHASVPAIPPLVRCDDEVRTWVADMLIPLHDVRVAELSGVELAMMALAPGWLDHLYVQPELWGHGIGTAMVDEAKVLQPTGLQAWVFATNAGARRFYERHGFVAAEHTDGSANEEGAPDVRYVWTPVADAPG